MGGYIRLDKDLEDDPRVLELTEYLKAEGIGEELALNSVIGGLYRLWRYADTHLERDRLKCALHSLGKVTGLPVTLLQKFPTEWLAVNTDGTVTLPRYTEKNALLDKDLRREKTRKRVEKWRQKQRQNGNALPKRQSNATNRYDPVTTGTGTGTSETGTETGEVAASPAPVKTGSAAPKKPEGGGKRLADILREREKPPEGRAPNFEEEFKRRFGCPPDYSPPKS